MNSNFIRQQTKSGSHFPDDIITMGSSSNDGENTEGRDAFANTAATDAQPSPSSSMAFLNHLEENLGHLQDEWATVDVILNSIKNAYPVQSLDNAPEELLDQVDRELCIAYDEVRSQIRQMSRSIDRLEAEFEPYLALHGPRSPSLQASRQHPSSGTAPSATFETEEAGQSTYAQN